MFVDMDELLIGDKKENECKTYQHGRMWVAQNEDYIASGMTEDEAIKNLMSVLNAILIPLKKKVDRDLRESRERHRKLWNY